MVIEEVPGVFDLPLDLIHQSKITIPPVRGIPRPHLVAQVEQGAQGKLTVVSAPAGWGKSTLLAEWASQSSLNVAWVSLDEDDVNPTRFFRSVVAALDHIYPLQMDDVFTMLRSPTPAINEHIDYAILSRLEEIPGHTAIVFDDFHVLSNQELLRSFGHVLEQLPTTIHFVVSTRGEIRLPLARLRSSGEVQVLRAEDLAFSVPEATTIIGDLCGAAFDDYEVRQLVERTEGWIAGLRLATVSIGNQRSSHAAIDRFRGTQRDVADYFHEEVLNLLEPDLKQFLIETSLLDTFTAPLCNEVTSRSDAQSLLNQSAAADLFLVPLDDERTWYRYHGLFRDLLLAEFARIPESRQIELHARASVWYERHAMLNEAVEHALQANGLERAANIVDKHADTMMYVCGETNMLVGWIERLPDQLLVERPNLMRVYAWALTMVGRIDQAERMMSRVCGICDACGQPPDHPEAIEREAQQAAVLARIAAYRNEHQATIVHGKRALSLLDPIRHGRVYGDVQLSIGFAERALGRTETAAEAFAEAARLGRLHGNVQAARWGVRYLAVTRISQGRLNEAEAILDEDLDRVHAESADPGSMLAALLVGKAEIQIERNRLGEARKSLDQVFPIVQRVGDAKMLMNAYVAMGMLLHASEKPDGAREKIRRAEEVFMAAHRGARVAWLALAQGNIPEAERWARFSGFSVDDEADPLRGEYEQIVFARIAVSTDPSPASIGLLERLIADAEEGGRFGRAIEMLNLHAVVMQRAGDSSQARRSLCRALTYARHEGFVRAFLHEGLEMRALLRDLVRDRGTVDERSRLYAMELLGQFSGDSSAAVNPVAIDEPLTARQLEILQLLAAGQSNRDIANQLYIAEGTVKAHMHQLFGKLMARNRTEAVANARDLHLIE